MLPHQQHQCSSDLVARAELRKREPTYHHIDNNTGYAMSVQKCTLSCKQRLYLRLQMHHRQSHRSYLVHYNFLRDSLAVAIGDSATYAAIGDEAMPAQGLAAARTSPPDNLASIQQMK